MRLIDADDFIERLHNVPMVQETIKKAMDHMPTIEPGPQWIPVSERLPKNRQVVLITNCKGNVSFGMYRGIDGIIGGVYWWHWKANTSEGVIAWMPLPEPYQEGDEE